MTDPHDEFRSLVRMVHDKLWLENSLGYRQVPGLSWPESAPAPGVRESPAVPGRQPPARRQESPMSAGPIPPRRALVAPPAGPPARTPPTPSTGPAAAPISSFQPEPGPFLSADSGLSKQERLDMLAKVPGGCSRCGLHSGRQNVVFGEGNPDADLMFIGEGPGFYEDQTGRPFVGKAGQLLDRITAAIEMERGDVYIANVVKCHPPADRQPDPNEAQACLPVLLAQIEIVQPKVICLLGATAAKYMTGTQIGITRLRGRWLDYKGIPMMPTYHPSYLLRNPSAKRPCWEDMQKVRDKVRELRSR